MWKKMALPLVLLLVITACSEGITSPNEMSDTNPPTVAQVDTNLTAMMSSLNLGSSIDSVYSTDEWFQTTIRFDRMGWVSCAGRTFVNTPVNLHLGSLVVTLKDSTVIVFQYVSVPSGTVLDASGNQYQFSELGGSTDYRATTIEKVWLKSTTWFKLVPIASGPIEIGTLSVNKAWDSTLNKLVTTSTLTVKCYTR